MNHSRRLLVLIPEYRVISGPFDQQRGPEIINVLERTHACSMQSWRAVKFYDLAKLAHLHHQQAVIRPTLTLKISRSPLSGFFIGTEVKAGFLNGYSEAQMFAEMRLVIFFICTRLSKLSKKWIGKLEKASRSCFVFGRKSVMYSQNSIRIIRNFFLKFSIGSTMKLKILYAFGILFRLKLKGKYQYWQTRI